ncbi:Lrp/AsnC family transcriptional regulator [Lacibacterium aquatile]|uniref:Lrp/AsnC family transcriptional regulator n=1 Tax=Lacibacterium aquatile TaxID=1168082 RepID=A0ABW5DR51_9PROT
MTGRMTGTGKEPDAVDRQLLGLLRENARLPLVALAAEIGLSRSATQERLKRLERDGVIERYTVRLGAGTGSVNQAWLSVRFADKETTCEKLLPHLRRFPEVRMAHSVAGPVDLMLLLEAASPAAIADVREAVNRLPGIANVETTMVLRSHLDR